MKRVDQTQKEEFSSDYKPFLEAILTKIQHTRYEMLMSVSKQTVLLYWDIGKAVSVKLRLTGWGNSVVEQLAKDLQTEIPGVRGFSARNIRNMKRFYEFYVQLGFDLYTMEFNLATTVAKLQPDESQSNTFMPDSATVIAELQNEESTPPINSATTVAELQKHVYELIVNVGWVQNCLILEKCKDLKQILFYLKQTKEKGWSKLDLLEKIGQNYFENHTLAQHNLQITVPETIKAQVAWEFLDDYNIELLNPDQPVSEKALEIATANCRKNMLNTCLQRKI